MTMDMKRLEAQLTFEEGRKNSAYKDSRGLWTIGIGHHDDKVCEGMVWTDAQIDEAFKWDVAEKFHQIALAFPWYTRLNDARQAVLIEMCFQMGLEKLLGFKNALAAMRDERFHDAYGHMLASDWARETPDRARRMALQMENGEWQS
jgi:lysozyme